MDSALPPPSDVSMQKICAIEAEFNDATQGSVQVALHLFL